MPANVKVAYYGGAASEPAGASVDGVGGAGLVFDRSDALAGSTLVPLRTAAGTNFSAVKQLALKVITAGGTTLSNRRLYASGAALTGVGLYVLAGASYLDQTGAPSVPGSSGSDGAAPAGYTPVTGTAVVYDAAGASGSAGRNGAFARLVLGVDNLYTAGPSTVSVPLVFEYDEV